MEADFINSPKQQDTEKIFCRVIFDVLSSQGIKDLVCSPGSRNAPLLLAAASRNNFKKHIVADERSAAFMALGIAMASGKPVILVCTSGTALLNYSPAVAEAYYHGVPLILLTADRPLQWIDQDDSQTLRQTGVFTNFIKDSFDIPCDCNDNPEMNWYVNRITNEAYLTSVTGKKGPVHINIRLSEPLGNTVQYGKPAERTIRSLQADTLANKETLRDLAKILATSRVMLVAGFMTPDSTLNSIISEFSRHPNVVIMAETISNLHLDSEFFSIDSTLTAYSKKYLDEIAPEIVISIGGALVSRCLKDYLRANSERIQHWQIGFSPFLADCFQSMTLRIEADPVRILKALNYFLRKTNFSNHVKNYSSLWHIARQTALAKKQEFIDQSQWSELRAFDYMLRHLPGGCNLILSNGTPVRYAQIINYKMPHASYCNRGVSGIDGSIATAIGISKAYTGNSILITGDLSFSYDVGSLGMQDIPDRLKIVVIDNQGGGIFRFIKSTSSLDELEQYFCADPKIPVEKLADAYGWCYYEAGDIEDLKKNWRSFLSSQEKSILKIKTDGKKGASILQAYIKINKLL